MILPRGSCVLLLLLLLLSSAIPLVVCTSSSALYQEDDSSATTTMAAAAADIPAAVTEQQHLRSSKLRGGGGGEDAVAGAGTDQEQHRRRLLRLTNTMTARRMQSATYSSGTTNSDSSMPVYNQQTGQWEQETTKRGTSSSITLPIIPAVLILIGCCWLYRHSEKQEQRLQQGTPVGASARTAAQRRVVQEAIQSSTTPRIIPKQELVVLPPRLVTAAATKLTPESNCGVFFVGTDYAQITRILSDSIFSGTELDRGMKIVSVNNIPISSAQQALASLCAAAPDMVTTIVAHSAGYYGSTENLVTATVTKEWPDQLVGINYEQEVSQGPIRLGAFPATSLLLRSPNSCLLTLGMEVIAVNNIPVQSIAQAVEVTRSAYPLVTILARCSSTVAVLAVPVAPSAAAATTEDGMVVVEAESVTSYTMSSRDVVATVVATPVVNNNDSSLQEGRGGREVTI
jgi:hypothetical protein